MHMTTTTTESPEMEMMGIVPYVEHGCTMEGDYYPDGAQVRLGAGAAIHEALSSFACRTLSCTWRGEPVRPWFVMSVFTQACACLTYIQVWGRRILFHFDPCYESWECYRWPILGRTKPYRRYSDTNFYLGSEGHPRNQLDTSNKWGWQVMTSSTNRVLDSKCLLIENFERL